jgi:hypothetical protein
MKTHMARNWRPWWLFAVVVALACWQVAPAKQGGGGGGGGRPNGETAGNNLSFPVVWAEGVEKALPGTPGMTPVLEGEYWYQWGTFGVDPDIFPASCPADPDELDPELNTDGLLYCDDGVQGELTRLLEEEIADSLANPPADPYNALPLARAYLQKDNNNVWQADSVIPPIDASDEVDRLKDVNVDWIDWGDNLESVDWYTRSQVRTEVVLFEDQSAGDEESYWGPPEAPVPLLEYEMRHTDGWGINEVHGLAATPDSDSMPMLGPGTRATVYSHCARLTIQKLLVPREEIAEGDLEWIPEIGWIEHDPDPEDPETPPPLINPPIFNMAVHEGGDGPGYYSAEINVKGRVIYGYTWSVRQLNDTAGGTAAGDYRITFSFDTHSGLAPLNTYFTEGITQPVLPLEEEVRAALSPEGEEPGGGGVAVIDFGNNLTYMDIRIHERSGGGGGGGKPQR